MFYSDRDICEALHHKDVCVKEAPTWVDYQYVAKLVWSAPHDHGDISSICSCVNYSSTVTKTVDSSGQALSSSNARELGYMNITDILAKSAPKCPKKPAVRKRKRNAKQVIGYFTNSSSGSNMSKDTASIKSSHQAQSYRNTRDQAVTNDFEMLVDLAPTAPKVPAVQNLRRILPHDTGYLFPPYSSRSDIANGTGSDNSSRQAQGQWIPRDHAPINDFDMVVDSATTGTNPQASGGLKSTTANSVSGMARDDWYKGGHFLAQNAWEATQSTWKANQSGWEATKFAYPNDYNILEVPAQTIPKYYTGGSDGSCDQWLTAFSKYSAFQMRWSGWRSIS